MPYLHLGTVNNTSDQILENIENWRQQKTLVLVPPFDLRHFEEKILSNYWIEAFTTVTWTWGIDVSHRIHKLLCSCFVAIALFCLWTLVLSIIESAVGVLFGRSVENYSLLQLLEKLKKMPKRLKFINKLSLLYYGHIPFIFAKFESFLWNVYVKVVLIFNILLYLFKLKILISF